MSTRTFPGFISKSLPRQKLKTEEDRLIFLSLNKSSLIPYFLYTTFICSFSITIYIIDLIGAHLQYTLGSNSSLSDFAAFQGLERLLAAHLRRCLLRLPRSGSSGPVDARLRWLRRLRSSNPLRTAGAGLPSACENDVAKDWFRAWMTRRLWVHFGAPVSLVVAPVVFSWKVA